MTVYADETRAAAATIEHEWDERAIDWPLDRKSTVIEIGAYKGRWALQIVERYRPRLFVFEPQHWAALVCAEILGKYTTTLAYGLGVRNEQLPMGAWGTDGCSVLKPGDGWGELREIGQAFKELKIDQIDLMLMNIEGYEYTLLPHMLGQGIYPDRLMVQFHTFADDPSQIETRRCRRMLKKHGYKIVWDYGMVLSAWERL